MAAGAQTFTGAATTAAGNLPVVVIDKPSGTLTLAVTAGRIRTTNNWTYTAGTLDPGTSTVVFAGSRTISGQPRLNDVDLHGAARRTPSPRARPLTVTGTLTLTDGTINTGTVAARGAISQASTFDGDTGTLLIDGTGGQTFTGAATTAAGQPARRGHQQALGHTHPGRHDPHRHSWTYTAGTLDPGTSTVVFAGTLTIAGNHTLNDVVFNGGGST